MAKVNADTGRGWALLMGWKGGRRPEACHCTANTHVRNMAVHFCSCSVTPGDHVNTQTGHSASYIGHI